MLLSNDTVDSTDMQNLCDSAHDRIITGVLNPNT